MSTREADLAFLDQLNAEYAEAERLVPLGQNRRLSNHPPVRSQIHRLLTECENYGHGDVEGTVPILQIQTAYPGQTPTAQRRAGTSPRSVATATWCNNGCTNGAGATVPFWVGLGTVIAQINLCIPCAKWAMDELGAVPQLGLPDISDGVWR